MGGAWGPWVVSVALFAPAEPVARSPEPSLIWARNMPALLDTLCSEALGIIDQTCWGKKGVPFPLQLPVSLNAKSATL